MLKKWTQAKLSQNACLMEGLCIYLCRTAGDFAVIIHSYADCANAFPRTFQVGGITPGRFYCTNLLEGDIMAGTTMERLRECIELVAEKKPEAIYLLGSCLSEIIGDDIARAAAEARNPDNIPIIPITASGLDNITQKQVIDWHAKLMYCACAPDAAPSTGTVNLVGFQKDEEGEIERILEQAGIKVNVWLDGGSPQSEWKKLTRGALNVVLDREMFPSMIDLMRSERGVPFVEAPAPLGISGTERFLIGIAGRFGVEGAMREVLSAPKRYARDRIASAMKGFKNKRLAYNIGSDRTYEPEKAAKDGLCEVGFFRELGFRITLLIQGSPDPERRAHITKQLKSMKIEADFDVFVDNVSFTPALMKARYNLVYCPMFLRDMVVKAHTPMISRGSLKMGFDGCVRNIETIKRVMTE